MIEEIEPENIEIVFLLSIAAPGRGTITITKTVDEVDDFNVLYIPEIDVSLYAKNLGRSSDGLTYKKFSFIIREDEMNLLPSILDSFFRNDWDYYADFSVDTEKDRIYN